MQAVVKERFAAAGMLICFIFLSVGALAVPPGMFGAGSRAQMVSLIEMYSMRWYALNLLWGLSGMFLFGGFLSLANTLWETQNRTLIGFGAAGFGVSGVSFAILSLLRVTKPGDYLMGVNALQLIWLWSLLLAVFIFGFILIQAGYPRWLGILSILAAVGLGMGTVTVNIDIAESAYLIPMVAAVVILLKPRSVNP